jgi:dGTPase
MPAEWLAGLEHGDAIGRALRTADYIAGMTDRYAIGEHARLLGSTPELK